MNNSEQLRMFCDEEALVLNRSADGRSGGSFILERLF